MQNYKLEKSVFTAADLSAILMGLYSLTDTVRGDDLRHALAKVKRFIPADRAQDIELKANQIYIDLSPWMGNRNTEQFMPIIKTALQEHRLLAFTYIDRHGNQTARIAEPYQLILKSNHWYFQGYCRIRADFRLFRLCRMADLQMCKETFSPRDYPKPRFAFDDVLAAMQTIITLRVHRSILDRVLDYCCYQDVSPDADDYYIVRIPFIENDYYYYDILLSFGDRCECLTPPHSDPPTPPKPLDPIPTLTIPHSHHTRIKEKRNRQCDFSYLGVYTYPCYGGGEETLPNTTYSIYLLQYIHIYSI